MLSRRSGSVRTYSPRAWGWTVLIIQNPIDAAVFPTCVGVDRVLRPSVHLP